MIYKTHWGILMKENTGKTKYVLLGLLARGPQTGYTIKKAIEYEYRHFWQESFGQIYPTLKVMEEEGLAESSNDGGSSNGRGQIAYTITEKGRNELRKWLAKAPDVEKLRYEILLKVSFGASNEPEVILQHLDDFKGRCEDSLKQMDLFLDWFEMEANQKSHYLNSELTALSGKYFYTAMRDWAKEAQAIIRERTKK